MRTEKVEQDSKAQGRGTRQGWGRGGASASSAQASWDHHHHHCCCAQGGLPRSFLHQGAPLLSVYPLPVCHNSRAPSSDLIYIMVIDTFVSYEPVSNCTGGIHQTIRNIQTELHSDSHRGRAGRALVIFCKEVRPSVYLFHLVLGISYILH